MGTIVPKRWINASYLEINLVLPLPQEIKYTRDMITILEIKSTRICLKTRMIREILNLN